MKSKNKKWLVAFSAWAVLLLLVVIIFWVGSPKWMIWIAAVLTVIEVIGGIALLLFGVLLLIENGADTWNSLVRSKEDTRLTRFIKWVNTDDK